MGLLFNRGDSKDGCGHHHWGEYDLEWHFARVESKTVTLNSGHGDHARAGDRVRILEVAPKEKATCIHDGCTATDRRTGPKFRIPQGALTRRPSSEEVGRILQAVAEEFSEGDDGDV